MAYHWPGNVRELENWIRKLTVIRDPDSIAAELQAKSNPRTIAVSKLSHERVESALAQEAAPVLEQVTKAKHDAETAAILAALGATRWNRKQAAAFLKIDYKALLYKMKKLGIANQPLPVQSLPAASEKSMAANANGD